MPRDWAPFLSQLHERQAEAGFLSRQAVEEVASKCGVSTAEAWGAVDFYHYFLTRPEEAPAERCEGPVCGILRSLGGEIAGETEKPDRPGTKAETTAHEAHQETSPDAGPQRNGSAAAWGEGEASGPSRECATTACPGLCDYGPARREGVVFRALGPVEGLAPVEAPSTGQVFAPPVVAEDGAVFGQAVRPGGESLDDYLNVDGYRQMKRLLEGQLGAGEALQTLHDSGLRGMGGAGFPVAVKWKAVRQEASIPKYVVCNADEGEPGTFKDRAILHLVPHRLIEGMALCGRIVGSTRGIIYLRYEYPKAEQILRGAIEEAAEKGLLGDFRIEIRRGAGSYVCGEETALLNSLEGGMPWPREKPPFPTQAGLFGRPTVINNVETLAAVPAILGRGAEWFAGLGRGQARGSKIYSVSGCVKRPGNYELPLGVTARELIEKYAGGTIHSPVKAFTLGGISGGFLGSQYLDMPLDFEHPAKEGFFLGSGGVVVLDLAACPLDFVRRCLLFYESESCGRCSPCRIGTVRLREHFDALTSSVATGADWGEHLDPLLQTMRSASACGLGRSVPLIVRGLLESCAEEVKEHRHGRCRNGVCFGGGRS
ncbi:MAG TPA: NADH-ubiquinone oxidoreductase-F iron-sulfur binding region domain-containing protein [Acidobacteriota bacterium]|nr:NADH-ubiquinone oxidoreductase-F iron-sulfur binding region domain-containing protein [Acidobacteriota bacterium]